MQRRDKCTKIGLAADLGIEAIVVDDVVAVVEPGRASMIGEA